MVMLWSLLSDARAFLSSAVGLDRGALTIARVADTFNGSCSAFVSASSLFLMADSDALMRSTTGICSEVPQSSVTSAGTSFSGRVSSLLDKFFTHSSCMSGFRFNMTWMTERSLHSLTPVTKLNTPTNRWI